MLIRSRVVGGLTAGVAVVVGVPLVGMLFLGVLVYCYLEWVHDTVASRLSIPTSPMRTVEARP